MNDLHILNIPFTCTGCGACASICPKGCIDMIADRDGFYYPTIKNTLCIDCHLCEKACHVLSSSSKEPISRSHFYAYRTNNESLRQQSTSGGAFSLFASYVIEQGGVVYGSRYNGDKERLEVCSSDICGLNPLRKSKYIESYLGKSFLEIKQQLAKGRWVLYCGTPCQAAGLRSYINKTKAPTDRLIILDFACHGVPSNGLFTRFKHKFEKKKKLVDAEFRVKDPNDPRTSWHVQTFLMRFNDGSHKVFRKNSLYYYFYFPFDKSLSLRLSCYDCTQVDYSEADITIGDFWDIKNFSLLKDDNKGTSFVKIHNERFLPLFLQLAQNDFVISLPDSIVRDPYDKSNKLNRLPERERFFRNTRRYAYFKAVRKTCGYWHVLNNTVVFQIKNYVLRKLNGLR